MWEGEYVNFSCVSTEKQPQYMVLGSIMKAIIALTPQNNNER
jgi:hypothetical protein